MEKAKADAELAAALKGLLEAVLADLSEAADGSEETWATGAQPPDKVVPPSKAIPPPAPATEDDIKRLIAAFKRRPGASPKTAVPVVATFSFDRVAANLRLKARASMWLVTHGFTTDTQALAERKALIKEGRAASCYLWMLDPTSVDPGLGKSLEPMAECYTALAEALALWQRVEGTPQEGELVQLVAQAQSALAEAVQRVRGGEVWYDPDQAAVFHELKRYASENERYLNGMTLYGRADPGKVADLRARIATANALLDENERVKKHRQQAINQLKYHVGLLQRGSGDAQHHWQRAGDAVTKLLALGVPESDPCFREPLRPILDLAPEELGHEALARVMAWIVHEDEQALRRQGLRDFKKEAPSADVTRLKELLAGRTLVLIGGHPKPESVSRLEQSLGCKVEWLESRPHQSPEEFRPALARADVLVVVLLIRWSSHVFGNVQAYCAEAGKLLVRAPGGYSVNTLAHTILKQVGKQLETAVA